jgi:hypothetical protein
MTKTPWEARVGMLLKHPQDFAWAFKPVDSRLYGGQPRLDWIACDVDGLYWLVEVKALAADRRSINLRTDVTPGQRDALMKVDATSYGVALLAIGQGNTLYIFDWGQVRWRLEREYANEKNLQLLPLASASWAIRWTGPTAWKQFRFRPLLLQEPVIDQSGGTPPTLIVPAPPSRKPVSSQSTSRPEGSIPTPPRTLRLVR